MTEEEVADVRCQLEKEVEEAAEYALAQPLVESTRRAERAAVFAPSPPVLKARKGPENERRYVDAVGEALRQAMGSDGRVLLMGQDIAEYGGVFKVSEGLLDAFGAARVRNTPIIESGALGAAMGLALEGYRPIVEMQYADFIACGFNQIVNNLATTHYRWGASLAITIRAPLWRPHRGGSVPLPVQGGVVLPRAGSQSSSAGHAARREGAPAAGNQRSESRSLFRAQVPVPVRARPGARRHVSHPVWTGARSAPGK